MYTYIYIYSIQVIYIHIYIYYLFMIMINESVLLHLSAEDIGAIEVNYLNYYYYIYTFKFLYFLKMLDRKWMGPLPVGLWQ